MTGGRADQLMVLRLGAGACLARVVSGSRSSVRRRSGKARRLVARKV